MLHGFTFGDRCLIGNQAVVMNEAMLSRQCIVTKDALVTKRKPFPDRSLTFGSPAKAVRSLWEDGMRPANPP